MSSWRLISHRLSTSTRSKSATGRTNVTARWFSLPTVLQETTMATEAPLHQEVEVREIWTI